MVYRLTWIGIAAGLLAALMRMDSLLRPATRGAPWQLVLIAALLLGAVITWVARSYRVKALGVIGLNLAGMALATIRIAAPDSSFLGLLPTSAAWSDLVRELTFGLDLIRFGTAPVVPIAGLILILTWIFWIVGILIVWGLQAGRPAVAIIPAIVLYLQLATMDRSPTSALSVIIYLAIIVATLAAVAHDERTVGTGRVRDSERSFLRGGTASIPIIASLLVLLIGVGATSFISNRTEAGVLDWRSTGIGGGLFGGISINAFAGVHQQLVNLSDREVFTADVVGDADTPLYWKLFALEEFDGANWGLRRGPSSHPPDTGQWEVPDQTFIGPTRQVEATVTIGALAMNYLPAPYSPVALASTNEIVNESLRARSDGTLRWDARTFEDMEYRVTSEIPEPSLGVLASNQGQLSPLFAQAARNGDFDVRSELPGGQRVTFEDRERLLDTSSLDEEDEAVLQRFAQELTTTAATNFERAVIIEQFFRSDSFDYDLDVAQGSSAENIVDWLLEPDSTNYRTGYCEQFAASMAIMARTLNIPARVIIGFAPGDEAADGTITVKENDAHAWVELWFNTQGWVRFDPTPRTAGDNPPLSDQLGFKPSDIVLQEAAEDAAVGRDPIDPALIGDINREELLALLNADRSTATPPREELVFDTRGGIPWGWLILTAGAIVVIVPPIAKGIRRRRRLAQLKSGDISAAWFELIDELADLGSPVPPAATPLEAAEAVSPLMAPLAEAYQSQIYGPERPIPSRTLSRAEESYGRTHQHLSDTHSQTRRLMRWLRVGSLRRR